MHSENIARLIEVGRDVHIELLRGDEMDLVDSRKTLQRSLGNIGVGAGILVFLTLLIDISIGSAGVILIGAGISQLIVWKMVDSQLAQNKLQD